MTSKYVSCLYYIVSVSQITANLENLDGLYESINSKKAQSGQIISSDPIGSISPRVC